MLLTLIKTRETRYGVHAVLIETNHIFGDKKLAEVYMPLDEVPLDLIYRVSVPKSGIWLQGKRTRWLWPRVRQRDCNKISGDPIFSSKEEVLTYLRSIQSTREEIRLEVTEM